MTIADENRKLLEKCQLFNAIDEESKKHLLARAYRRSFIAGEKIFGVGSPGQSMMVVSVGTVRITYPSDSGKEMILADLTPGEVFGEMSLLDENERSADAVSLTKTELLILERREVLPLLEVNPQLCLKLLAVLCLRLRSANELIGDMAFYDLPKRLAKQILRLAPQKRVEIDAPQTKLACSQMELANMIGASRENVNRCLKAWQRRGIVHLEEGWIVLMLPGTLEQLAVA